MKTRFLDEELKQRFIPYEKLSDEMKDLYDKTVKGIDVYGPYDSLEDALIANGRERIVRNARR